MPIELKVPEIGESITDVHIAQWRKQVGDSVGKDENLVEIESDKATIELPAPISGVVTQILKQQGQQARVGEIIGYMDLATATTGSPGPVSADGVQSGPATAAAGPTPTTGSAPPSTSDSARVMPAAQQLMSQEHLSASAVVPSGPGNRILKEDVQRAIDQRGPASNASPSLGAASSTASSNAASSPVERSQTVVRVEPRPSSITAGGGNGLPREEEYVVMSPIRRRIAERLVQAQQNAALLTTFNEVDMSEVIALRGKHRAQYEKQYGVKLGFMSFFVKAVVDALKGVPQLNAEVREPHIVYRNYYDIGIAVGGGKGLVVPVLRNAEFMSFGEIEQKIADFGRRAAENKLKLEELQGGTFTISNGGVYGSMLSTPIINPPQSGILGLHAIEDRPAVRDGQVVARPMMYVALTYDHRIVDGREAVLFLKRVKDVIEEPTRMLLEI